MSAARRFDRTIVDIGELRVSTDRAELLVTHALGSCVGVTLYDPISGVGAMLHALLPRVAEAGHATRGPTAFVDSGIELALARCIAEGAVLERLVVKVAGGARVAYRGQGPDMFAIGERNVQETRRTMWRLGLVVTGIAVGGTDSRNMSLSIADGEVTISSNKGKVVRL